METIIFTDNKRISTDYCADKTLFAQKIDVNHILNTEVYQSHISKVRFWIVRTNIASQQNLILEVCKNLVNKGSNLINFQFSITKILLGQQTALNEQKKSNNTTNNDKFRRTSRVSAYMTPSMLKTLQFPAFMTKKQSTHGKTSSNIDWIHQNEFDTIQQSKRTQQQNCTSNNKKAEQISLKQICKKSFQLSSLNELNTIFMNRQSIYAQFGLNEDFLMNSKRIITNYTFKQNQIQIEMSIISQGSRKYLEKAINIEISEAFNIQFNSRKQEYQSNCITQNFSSTIPKSTTKLTQQITKQTYHKILLFLFTHSDNQSQKSKNSSIIGQYSSNLKQYNKFVQAIQEWKMKDQDINITEKLSKQYVLIKQEVENQKSSFKNKLKIFEAIIGESVNVDKLLNQQKQMETSPNLSNNQVQIPVSGNDLNLRVSRKSELKSLVNAPVSPQTNIPQQNSSSNSQFKRLKQSFEMIRNIDNVINQQSKKIQNLKKYLKETVKQKNEILYKHARSINQIKKQIHNVKDQIEEKNLQFQYKLQKSQIQNIQKKRNFLPTKQTQQILSENVKLLKRIVQNQRTNKNNQKYLIEEQFTSNKENHRKSSNSKDNKNSSNLDKKQFLIRKQYKSFYSSNNSSQQNQSLLNSNLSQNYFSSLPPEIFKTISQEEKQKQSKLLKKRQEEVQHHNIWMNVNKQKNPASQSFCDNDDLLNEKEKQILINLYKYFRNNHQLLLQIDVEIKSYRGLNNQKMEMAIGNNIHDKCQLFLKNSLLQSKKENLLFQINQNKSILQQTKRTVHNSLHQSQKSSQSASQLNLLQKSQIKSRVFEKDQFQLNIPNLNLQVLPLLNSILHPRISQSAFQSEQCSVISDEIQIQQNFIKKESDDGVKRITLENMFAKK